MNFEFLEEVPLSYFCKRMKKIGNFIVCANLALNKDNHLLKVTPKNKEKLSAMHPGQFVQILVENSSAVFLRRPISINFIDESKNEMWLLVQKVGEGTQKICAVKPHETLNIIFPLGNSFSIPSEKQKKTLLVGGGVGTAPMLFLGKKLFEQGIEPDFLLGGHSEKNILQLADFEKYGNIYCTTEDDSMGEKGFVTDHSILRKKKYNIIYTCGPKPMMQAVANYAYAHNITCEVSLENIMACGFGACLCCIEKTIQGNVCTCTEGPVFNINELTWND